MHNVSVGDIFVNSNEVYRVKSVSASPELPDDPYIDVDVFTGSCFEQPKPWGFEFTLSQSKDYSLQHYKAV